MIALHFTARLPAFTNMKTSQLLLVTAAALSLVSVPARAEDLLGSMLDLPTQAQPPRHRGRSASPAKGLQLSSGLQTSGPLNGSGPAPVAVRLSEEDWRKVFPRKVAGK